MGPCVRLKDMASSFGRSYVPVLGPKHEDADHLDFKYEHYHPDVRFLGEAQVKYWQRHGLRLAYAAGYPVCVTKVDGTPLAHTLKTMAMQCLRDYNDHVFPKGKAQTWDALRRAYRDCKLKPGMVCPHRGFRLAPHVRDDGLVVCPGHGLVWDTKTGKLVDDETAFRIQGAVNEGVTL